MKSRIIILFLLLSFVLSACADDITLKPTQTERATQQSAQSATPTTEATPAEQPTVQPTEAVTDAPSVTVEPLQISEAWDIPKGNVRLLFSSGMAAGVRVTNAEGNSYQYDISGAKNDLEILDERVTLEAPARVYQTVPYSASFTVDKNICAENFSVTAVWNWDSEASDLYSVSAKGSSIEKIVLSVSGVEICGTNMSYTLKCEDLENPDRYLEISGSGENSVKLQRINGGILAIATQNAQLRVVEEIAGSQTVLAEQALDAMNPCEVTQISQTPSFSTKEPITS